MIVRWGLESLAELVQGDALLIASERWSDVPVRPAQRWTEVPSERVDEAASLVGDTVVAVGGGSAIDFGKAVSARAGVPLVSVPTTYAGAEWTDFYGIRATDRRAVGGGGGANLYAVVYEPRLTLGLPRETTVGTAMNALAHCAEALYVAGHNADADAHALAGARLIGDWLPKVVELPQDLIARTRLLEGACHAGQALGGSMLALGHAMAQAIGGTYGLPHGTLNGIVLPAALRFNEPLAPDAVHAFRDAVGRDVTELAALASPGGGGATRLQELGVSEEALPELARAAAGRPGNQANPRPATPDEIEELLRSVY